jgi:hypothetical protein
MLDNFLWLIISKMKVINTGFSSGFPTRNAFESFERNLTTYDFDTSAMISNMLEHIIRPHGILNKKKNQQVFSFSRSVIARGSSNYAA